MTPDEHEIWPSKDNPGASMHIFFGDQTINMMKAEEWQQVWKAYADMTRIMANARARAKKSPKTGSAT